MIERISQSRLGRIFAFLAGASVSAICLYLAFQKTDWLEVWHHIKTMKLWALFLGLFFENISNFLLAKRWAILLQPLGQVSYWTAFWSLRISFFFNATLPARLGEPFRIYFINRKAKIPAGKAIGAMGADRFLDFVTMLMLLYLSVIVLGMRGTLPPAKIVVASSLLVLLTFLILKELPKSHRWKWLNAIFKLRANVFEGMAPLLKWEILAPTVPISLIGWCIHASVIVGFSYALGVPMSLFKAFLVVAAVNVAIAIPSSPGHIGTFELGAITMLRYFGVPFEESASIAILYHMVQLVPTLLIGAYGYYFHLLKLPQKLSAASSAEADQKQIRA
jgi:uncharacterized membrane protein YbhN (UPF0104 family)